MNMLRSIIIFGLVLTLCSCSLGTSCENEVLDRVESPNGKFSAIVFSRNCGATTAYNVQVSVLPQAETPEGGGNALIMDKVPDYSSSYRPIWRIDGRLTLTIPKGARIFVQNERVDGISITFNKIL